MRIEEKEAEYRARNNEAVKKSRAKNAERNKKLWIRRNWTLEKIAKHEKKLWYYKEVLLENLDN